MKRQNIVKKFMAGVLVLATAVTAGALLPASTQAAAKPGKAAVKNVEAYLSQ